MPEHAVRTELTLLFSIRCEQLISGPPRPMVEPFSPLRRPLLRRVEAELVLVRLGCVEAYVVLVPQPQDLLERQSHTDKVQHGLDILDRENAAEDLALVTGARRADQPGTVAQPEVLVPKDSLRGDSVRSAQPFSPQYNAIIRA